MELEIGFQCLLGIWNFGMWSLRVRLTIVGRQLVPKTLHTAILI